MNKTEHRLFEGSYQYFRGQHNYSQENFSVTYNTENQHVLYQSEVLTRVDTGEFFKLRINYEVTSFFTPYQITVERSLGERYALETYVIDHPNQMLKYTFKTVDGQQELERPWSPKHFITAPSLLTAAIFTMSKKLDTSSRTPVTFITSINDWEYLGPLEEQLLFAELRPHESGELEINGGSLQSTHIDLYEHDTLHGKPEAPTSLYISKYISIPYQMVSPDGIRVSIENLKKISTDHPKLRGL